MKLIIWFLFIATLALFTQSSKGNHFIHQTSLPNTQSHINEQTNQSLSDHFL